MFKHFVPKQAIVVGTLLVRASARCATARASGAKVADETHRRAARTMSGKGMPIKKMAMKEWPRPPQHGRFLRARFPIADEPPRR